MYGLLEFDLGNNNVGHVELHFGPTQVTLLLPGSGVNRTYHRSHLLARSL